MARSTIIFFQLLYRGNKTDDSVNNHSDGRRTSLPDYATIINAILGKSERNGGEPDGELVRIAGYSLVGANRNASVERPFSARFDCIHRTYRYYFVRAHLDVSAMQEAADYLTGEHDFRNLCKLDYRICAGDEADNSLTKIKSHKPTTRLINYAVIKDAVDDHGDAAVVIYIEINGSAFLWHQIRCIMCVLFLVGLKREQPTIIQALLDSETFPRKPSYCPASAFPLVLWNCQYPSGTLPAFHRDDRSASDADDTATLMPLNDRPLKTLLRDLHKLYMEYTMKAAMIKDMIRKLCSSKSAKDVAESLSCAIDDGFVKTFIPAESQAISGNKYTPLLKRK